MRQLVLLSLLFGSVSPAFAHADLCDDILSARGQEVFTGLHATSQGRFRTAAGLADGNIAQLVQAAFKAVSEEMVLSLPPELALKVRAQVNGGAYHTYAATRTITEDFTDPSPLQDLSPFSKEYLNIAVPEETAAVAVARELFVLGAVARLSFSGMRGVRATVVQRSFFNFAFNPYPDIMIDDVMVARRLAGYEWDFLNLVPIGDSDSLAAAFERQRQVLLNAAGEDAAKVSRTNALFDKIKAKVASASSLDRQAYVRQATQRRVVRSVALGAGLMPVRWFMDYMLIAGVLAKFGYHLPLF